MSNGSEPSDRLTRLEMNPRGGCQCKLPGLELRSLLGAALQPSVHAAVPGEPQDCGLMEVDGVTLLLNTELNPIVGVDLRQAGRIAALHAMSDLYASGAVPRWAAINLVVDPEQPLAYAERVLAGIQEACSAEGAVVIGGHTIIGPEALAGVTVIGSPRTGRVLTKRGVQPGHALLLSKPLGVGLVLRAYRLGLVDDAALDATVLLMTTSNATASQSALAAGVYAATDVTGFGLLGHLVEMLTPGYGASLSLARVPTLAAVNGLPAAVWGTVWVENNRDYVVAQRPLVGIGDTQRLAPLFDPQTNGGLLVSAPISEVERLIGAGFTDIGRVTDSPVVEITE